MAVQKGIKSRLELLSLANQEKKEGKTDLAEFIANRGYKAVEEALRVGWEMEEAPAKLERNQKTRMEILEEFLQEQCVSTCNKKWLTIAKDCLAHRPLPTRSNSPTFGPNFLHQSQQRPNFREPKKCQRHHSGTHNKTRTTCHRSKSHHQYC